MISFTLQGLPPTTNKAYSSVRGVRILSSEGRKYKQNVRLQMLELVDASMAMVDGHWYSIDITYVFTELLTKGKNAKSPILRIDTTNREKLLVDVLSEILGFDDACLIEVRQRKKVGAEPCVHVVLEKLHAFKDA
jgi:Holliday junction resolvase RusA-like endonuclease